MSIMSDLHLGITVYNDRKDKKIYSEIIAECRKKADSKADETASGVKKNTDCIKRERNPLVEELLIKAFKSKIQVEPEDETIEEPIEYDEETQKIIDRETAKAIAVGADPRIIESMPCIVDSLISFDRYITMEAHNYTPQSIDMTMIEHKYNLRRALRKTPDKNDDIIDFARLISATPQSANSFKHIYSMKRSENGTPKLMLFYNQSVNLDLGYDFTTAQIGFQDIRTITFHTYLDWYITKNSFVGDVRRTENLFSFDNIVIDVDNHSDDITNKELNIEISKLIACLLKSKDLDFPEFNFVFTGRGVQLWIGLVSFTARKDSMKKLYTTFCEKLCDIVKNAIEKYGLRLEVDDGASKDMCRFVRIPYTTNTKAHKKAKFKQLTEKRYTVDELCQRFDIKKATKKEKTKETKETVKTNQGLIQGTINYQADFASLYLKRTKFIEQIISNCNGNCNGRREVMLFHYHNACRQICDDATAVESTIWLNTQFSEPLHKSTLEAIFREKTYTYSNATFLKDVTSTVAEQSLYINMTGRQAERDKAKKLKEERNQKIIALIETGYTNKQIADIVHCHVNTVYNFRKDLKEKTSENIDDTRNQKPTRQLPKNIAKSVTELYNKGYKQKAIAEKLNIAESTVSDILKPYKKKMSPRDRKIIELWKQGYTQQKIADEVGYTRQTVMKVINTYKNSVPAPITNPKAEENVTKQTTNKDNNGRTSIPIPIPKERAGFEDRQFPPIRPPIPITKAGAGLEDDDSDYYSKGGEYLENTYYR